MCGYMIMLDEKVMVLIGVWLFLKGLLGVLS